MKTTVRATLAAGSCIWLIASASPALAQQQTPPAAPAPPAPATADTGQLQEIIVTAQRTETNLQRTPVAVTSLSAEGLKDRGISNILELSAMAPNVSIGTRSGGASSGAVTIRGIGIDAAPPASPSVGIYVDEVYFPAAYGNLLGLFDVSQIEVLRGPQGTLFGRNTIAGALQYTSIKPKLHEYNGFGEATFGNLSTRDFSAGVNIPIGEIAALRVSGALTYHDGYVHDILNNINRGSDNDHQLRAQLHVEPASNLTIDLKGEYLAEHSNGRATISTAFNYNTVFGAPFAPSGLNQFISPNFYTIAGYNDPEYSKTGFKIGQGIIKYKLTDDIILKSITAYSESTSSVRLDNDGTPLPILATSRGDITDKLFTQELQLTGNSLGARLRWTLGGYYYNDKSLATDNTASIFGGPPSDPFGDNTIRTVSIALYGQATFNITDQLAVVGGLRYTHEKVTATDVLRPDTGLRSFKDTSPLLGLNFQATSSLLFYAKASRGFRAGGFSPNSGGYFYFGPENATTYEAGARMEFLDHRLRINPTIFETNWKNIQFNANTIVPGIAFPFPIIENAGDARIKGAEMELQAAVTRHFMVSASGSLLDSHYTSIDPSQIGHITLSSDLKRAPKSAFTLGGRYEIPFAGDQLVALSANYAWQANQRSATSDLDNVPIPAYGLLSARIEYKPKGSLFTISAFATNLTNVHYIIGGVNFGNGGTIPVTAVDVGPPRQYGVTARVNF